MASYSEEFKLACVGKLEFLKEKGTINLEGVQIKNVRELVAFLGISSYSIYKWYKEIQYEGRNMDLESVKKDIDVMSMGELEESLKEDFPMSDDFSIEDKEMREVFGKKEIETKPFKSEQRFYGFFASQIGIKGYGDMPLAQLKLTIGNRLIKESGVVDNNKVKKELRIE